MEVNNREIPLVGASFNTASVATGDSTATFGLDFWVGVNPETRCVCWGSSAFDLCINECDVGQNPTQAELEATFKDQLQQGLQNLKDDLETVLDITADALQAVFVGIIILLIIILFVLINIATGGSVGA